MARKARPGPSLRAQWLGQLLRRRRESLGLTLTDAGDFLQRDGSMVSKYETAKFPIRRGDVLALLDLYQVSDKREREAYTRLSEDMWQKGWWDEYTDTVDHQFVDFAWLESRADKICAYESMMIPGLLQTRDYAEAMIRTVEGPDAPPQLIARGVELRLARQRVIADDDPKQTSMIIDESVLLRPVGGVEVMRNQLQHLTTAARQPQIDIRILPLSAGGHVGMPGTFHLFEMADPYPDVAFIDNLAGRLYVEEPNRVERFHRAYDQLWKTALGPKKSIELITAAMEDRRDTPTGTNL